jgi:glycosyltransferase involved in cell wall biosynthesis
VSDGEDGFVVDPGDVEELANKILRLIEDRDLAMRFGENGCMKVQRKYSDVKYGENLKALINDISSS